MPLYILYIFGIIFREALLVFMEMVHSGVKGMVLDLQGRPLPGAEIKIKGIDHTIRATGQGDYFRLLAPGQYEVRLCMSSSYHD